MLNKQLKAVNSTEPYRLVGFQLCFQSLLFDIQYLKLQTQEAGCTTLLTTQITWFERFWHQKPEWHLNDSLLPATLNLATSQVARCSLSIVLIPEPAQKRSQRLEIHFSSLQLTKQAALKPTASWCSQNKMLLAFFVPDIVLTPALPEKIEYLERERQPPHPRLQILVLNPLMC